MCTLRRICVLICVKTKVSAKGFSCSVNVKRHKSCAYIRYSKPNVDMFCTFPVGLGCCVLKWWRIVMALCHHIEWVKAEQWNRADMFSQKSWHHYSFSWTLSVVISIQKIFCIPKWNIFLPFFFFFFCSACQFSTAQSPILLFEVKSDALIPAESVQENSSEAQ